MFKFFAIFCSFLFTNLFFWDTICMGEIMLKFVSNNENETKEIGYNLASKLDTGDIVILTR